jgi:hypothetical protein
MNLWYDIPHVNINGEVEYIHVELIAYPKKEVGGSLEYEHNPNAPYDKYFYVSCEMHGIKFKNRKYTEDQKISIAKFMQESWESIENDFVREFLGNEEN